MLRQLSIRNIALIENLVLEPGEGFTVLSGETGAGKSIIIDALNLVLGERADKELVRSGEAKARVEGVFSLEDTPLVKELLAENGIDTEDDTLIILRELSADGKNLCRINGTAVTLAFLKKTADKLADIHGQHEHQLLLDKANHLSFLDSFGGDEIARQKESVRLACTYYQSCIDQLNGDWGTEEERERRMEMLQYQIDEIENAEVTVGQEAEYRARADRIKHADKIRDALTEAGHAISDSAIDQIRAAMSVLSRVSDKADDYQALQERLDSAFYELEDIAEELDKKAGDVDADPYELENLEERLSVLKKLFRKYGPDEEAVLKYYDDASEELLRLHNAEETIAELENQAERFKKDYMVKARRLSELRHDAAIAFEDRIRAEMEELGMKDASLEVDFGEEGDSVSPDGIDTMEFLFSANKGEPVKPLSRIISGGEMSRFMLAMKSVAADDAMLPTMVFDEIDTGISGQGAQVVAQKIARLSRRHQVLAVTHLPQLASMADCHFLIRKVTDASRTHTEVLPMTRQERVREIARLAGGAGTELAVRRADEILAEAERFKRKTE